MLAPRTPTFADDVAPLVHRSCTPCHRTGGSAPFPLTTYDEVRRRAREIGIVTRLRQMPPWKPDPGYGSFLDERRLSDEELELLESWIAADAPLGDAARVPAPPVFDGRWQLGEPDLVLATAGKYLVPAEGKDHYRVFVLPTGTTEERWVRALDFQPDNRAAVHHLFTVLDTTGSGRASDAADPQLGFDGMLAGEPRKWFGMEINACVPGTSARWLPEGSAWRLAPGVFFLLVSHFQTTGKVEPVGVSVGLYFARE